MEQQSIKIHLNDKTIILKLQEFDAEVDLDDLTKIHYENIYGEIVTVSTLLNKVGQLKAEVDNQYAEKKLDLDIYEANLRKTFKSTKIANGEKFNLQDIEDLVLTDVGFKNHKLALIRKQKEVDSIDSAYWAVKSKDNKLSNLKNNITPKEFESEIVEGVINTIMVRKQENVVGKVAQSKEVKLSSRGNVLVDQSEQDVICTANVEQHSTKLQPNKDFDSEKKGVDAIIPDASKTEADTATQDRLAKIRAKLNQNKK